ncbi:MULTISPECIES: hypothetical protein [Acinetobacter calcoaceticus/baumannii complex]|uniref:hypothetical protein n=1 Tax=Acinetobacter calcoaceticus/baumannii complex TaxID=909768 RepID=UPI0015F4B121|nr:MULTISPECIES: hypothetical protein [Acinetobacter calcoaceticus/baumannii complex]MDX8253048.1 hypothetical protein [Acinetobacter pittii]
MSRTLGEEIALVLGNSLAPALTKLSQVLQNPEVASTLKDILLAVKQHQELSPHVSKLLDEMKNNPNLSEALETVPYVQLVKLLTNSEVKDNVSVLDLINDAYFQRTLFYNFDAINISNHFKNRRVLIEEALQLYKLGMYAGCLTLLHSQFEGILTDYLIYKNIIEKKIVNSKTKFKMLPSGPEITGLAKKIDLAKTIGDTFKRLESYIFDNDQNVKFHNERNDILHGSNIANFNKERCFVVFIWIDSILDSIYMEEVLPTTLPSANAAT